MPSSATPSLRHLGINAVFLRPRMGGLEAYVKQLVPELLALRPGMRVSIFLTPAGREALAGERWVDEVRMVTHPLIGRRGLKAASELTLLGELAQRRGCSLLHSVAMTGPLQRAVPHVVTVADVTWIVAPEPREPATVMLWRAIVPLVARRAQRVIAISRAARDHIVEHLGVPAERIDVTPLAAGAPSSAEPVPERELRARLGLPDGPIVLAVSQKRRHKNLLPLVDAVAGIDGAVLVLPGNPTPHEQELRARARELGVADRVAFPPYVEPGELEGLYRAATVFACPSVNEGFGLPVLEAMQREVPVVCSNVSSLPEVAGDAARLCDPHDVASIRAAVDGLLRDEDERRRLVAAGRARAATFTWRATAERTLESYDRALATWAHDRARA